MTKDEALKLALEALNRNDYLDWQTNIHVREAIREALAQPEQEPVATLWQHGETGRTRITMPGDITNCDARWFKAADLYTSPPQRKPLLASDIVTMYDENPRSDSEMIAFARAIEAAHGIKE